MGKPCWIHCAIVCLLAACAAPELEVRSTPPDARLFLDGVRVENPTVGSIPYYGSVAVTVLPAPSARGAENLQVAEELLPIEARVGRLLFPLDLLVDLGDDLTGGPPRYERSVTLQPRTDGLVVGEEPTGLEALRHAARTAAGERKW